MSERLCPPPEVGDKLVTGFRCYGSLVAGIVVAVYERPSEWAALVITNRKARFEAIDHVAVWVGHWRGWHRRNEHPNDSDDAQERDRARWGR
jgi:hypothetical protein